MNTTPCTPIVASENPLRFTPEGGMAPCCLDPVGVLATQGAIPIEALQSKGCRPNDGNGSLTEALLGWLRPTGIQSLPA
jgi:hypothetical protein